MPRSAKSWIASKRNYHAILSGEEITTAMTTLVYCGGILTTPDLSSRKMRIIESIGAARKRSVIRRDNRPFGTQIRSWFGNSMSSIKAVLVAASILLLIVVVRIITLFLGDAQAPEIDLHEVEKI
ncbi:MAG: hypothetical protein JSU72_02495 [Deltaproteobacteria bacterium]|nr:MAG: hypothetical protein JSU72_02495 [Deltaproteobacteria bacterium]